MTGTTSLCSGITRVRSVSIPSVQACGPGTDKLRPCPVAVHRLQLEPLRCRYTRHRDRSAIARIRYAARLQIINRLSSNDGNCSGPGPQLAAAGLSGAGAPDWHTGSLIKPCRFICRLLQHARADGALSPTPCGWNSRDTMDGISVTPQPLISGPSRSPSRRAAAGPQDEMAHARVPPPPPDPVAQSPSSQRESTRPSRRAVAPLPGLLPRGTWSPERKARAPKRMERMGDANLWCFCSTRCSPEL